VRRAIPLIAAIALGCPREGPEPDAQAEIRALLGLPDHLEVPAVPDYNPLSAEKIELGQRLFYDRRLSGNGTQACADCHFPDLAFSDALDAPTGSTGEALFRNSQGLANVGWNASLTWASDVLLDLEDQIHVPIRSDNPIELGVNDGNEAEVLARFDADPEYAQRFAEAFPESDSGVTMNKVVFALASFVRSLVSSGSPYDQWLAGDRGALTDQQKLGKSLFEGERFECFHCHSGVNATVSYRDWRTTEDTYQMPFFNNGLYNVGGDGSYPALDQGLYNTTLDPDHRGLFRPQGLRNVAVTAPYMHDGSLATLRDVLEHYARGGTLTESGPNAGDGRLSPLKSGLIRGFEATDEEIDAVIAFLESMTDPTFGTLPAHTDPFAE